MALASVFLLLTPLAFMLTGPVVRSEGVSGYNVAMQIPLWALLGIGLGAFVVTGLIRGNRKTS